METIKAVYKWVTIHWVEITLAAGALYALLDTVIRWVVPVEKVDAFYAELLLGRGKPLLCKLVKVYYTLETFFTHSR